MGWLILIPVTAAAVTVLAVRARFWPYGPCRVCQGRKGRGWGSRPDAYSRCRRCGGSGERVRPLALIWPRHREEARKRKEARRK